MTWVSPESDLRTKLSDNSTDKHCYRKRCFGQINGTNTRFKTLEFRRVTDFTVDAPPLGIWLNGALIPASSVASDNLPTGDFILNTAPADGDILEASYYSQWFNDAEIELFLKTACQWLALGENYVNIPAGLQPAALSYAAAEGYEKLSVRWAQMLSEQYLLQDAIEKERFALVETWARMAKQLKADAYKSRDDYYSRSGQSNLPFAGSISGRVSDPVPRR